MKLKPEFIIHNAGDEALLVPVGGAPFSGLVKGNKTLGAVLDLLKVDTTEAEIVAALCARAQGAGRAAQNRSDRWVRLSWKN